jgi:hypothetical protein
MLQGNYAAVVYALNSYLTFYLFFFFWITFYLFVLYLQFRIQVRRELNIEEQSRRPYEN